MQTRLELALLVNITILANPWFYRRNENVLSQKGLLEYICAEGV
jgi:hypothetical protein